MPNPFFYNGGVQPNEFVGRQDELRSIFNCLETVYTGQMQSISVVGPRLIGRSSLLTYVAARYHDYLQNAETYRVAYISLRDAECHTPTGLLRKILHALGADHLGPDEITPARFQSAIYHLREQQVHPVVCLDEFEEVVQAGTFDNAFFDSWRHLMSGSEIAFVIASTRLLDELVAPDKYTSSFFNIFTLVQLGEFSDAEAGLLVASGVTCDRPFDLDDQHQMRDLGGRHPYKLQVTGSKIYLAKSLGAPIDREQVRNEVEMQLRQVGLATKPLSWLTMVWRKAMNLLRSHS